MGEFAHQRIPCFSRLGAFLAILRAGARARATIFCEHRVTIRSGSSTNLEAKVRGSETSDTCIESGKLVEGDAPIIPLEQMTDEQFERRALDILHRELGLYGLARFLRLYRAGTGDYTQDRPNWLHGVTVRDLAKEFDQKNQKATTE